MEAATHQRDPSLIDGVTRSGVKKRSRAVLISKIVHPKSRPRRRGGDWEADLIQGAAETGFLLSLYERKSRVGKFYKLTGKESVDVAIGTVMTLGNFEVKTITSDNGLELARHGLVNDLLESESYFCKPYSSWEKGGVANDNGVVRQYFPKGSDFTGITLERLQEGKDEINNRPRNILGYASPNDLLAELEASYTESSNGGAFAD